MKPDEARRRHLAAKQRRAAAGEMLEEAITSGITKVRPDLIPTEEDRVAAARRVRELISQANRQPKGARRSKTLDRLILALARLVYVERVLALDRLERAGLTPPALWEMSSIGPDDLRDRLASMRGESRVEVE